MKDNDYRNARAEKKAAKARAKALRPWYRKKRTYLLGFAGLIALIVIITATSNGGGSTPTAANPQATVTQPLGTPPPPTVVTDPDGMRCTALDANGYCPGYDPPSAPASAPASPATPASPAMTTVQQQAVQSAQEYLSMGSGFSHESLLNQLTSSAGDGFSQSDAEFAINYLHPDWDHQAVEAAKNYMSMGGFSRSSLIQQLTSSAGDGFTESQAEYAATQVGL